MQLFAAPGHHPLSLAYIVLNIDPVLLRLGPLSIHWYGLMYVLAISMGLWAILRYTRTLGIHEDQVWGLFMWTAIAGLVGGRLYFVVQQPDLVSNYLLNPLNIFAVWNGGMAFFGAIFCGTATLFALAPRYGMDRWIAIDGGALFAAVGQIFGRFGNIINGDILGQAVSSTPVTIPANTCVHAPCLASVSDPHILPWAVVYINAHSFAAQGIPYQPAPVYEMLFNLAALAVLWPLRYRLPRIKAGLFFVLYVALYAISQFLVFFARGSEPFTPFLGITTLKQAQWTAIFVFLLCVPLLYLVMRYSRPWTHSLARPVSWGARAERAATAEPREKAKAQAYVTRATAPARQSTISANGPEPSVADLPPWQPVHPTGGQLRNVFGSGVRQSDEGHLS